MQANPEHDAFMKKINDPRYYGEQDENGVDLSLIQGNLRLTPLERLRKGDAATTDALRIRRHAQQRI